MTLALFLFLAVHTAGCLVTCWYALTGINACTRKTALAARISFGAIAIGSFAALLNPPDMDLTGMGETFIAVGIGVGFWANRKKCVCLLCPMRPGPRNPAPIHWTELQPPEARAEAKGDRNTGACA